MRTYMCWKPIHTSSLFSRAAYMLLKSMGSRMSLTEYSRGFSMTYAL